MLVVSVEDQHIGNILHSLVVELNHASTHTNLVETTQMISTSCGYRNSGLRKEKWLDTKVQWHPSMIFVSIFHAIHYPVGCAGTSSNLFHLFNAKIFNFLRVFSFKTWTKEFFLNKIGVFPVFLFIFFNIMMKFYYPSLLTIQIPSFTNPLNS